MSRESVCVAPPLPGLGRPELTKSASLLAGREPELFAELWRACAGPLVELPQTGERVFYFLQGHLEQLQEATDPALLAEQIKMFQVPNKILCKVVNVELKVIPFIHIHLLPFNSVYYSIN